MNLMTGRRKPGSWKWSLSRENND